MPSILPVCKYGVSLRGFDVCTRWAKANLGKLQSAGMLTWWCFERFFDTIIWLLSCGIHGRGSRPGRVLVTPSRGAYLFIGLILHQLGGNGGMGCDRLGGGGAVSHPCPINWLTVQLYFFPGTRFDIVYFLLAQSNRVMV